MKMVGKGQRKWVYFFVTGATEAFGKPSYLYSRICRKDPSVLTHGSQEVLRPFQGDKHNPRGRRLRLETPGWHVLELEEDALSDDESQRQHERFLRGPLLVRDREYPFAEDLIVADFGTPGAILPVLAKVLSLIEMLRLDGPYELVHHLWSQSTLTASRVKIDVTLSRDEVLLASIFVPYIFVSV